MGDNDRLDQTDNLETTWLVQPTLTGTKPEVKGRCGKVCKNLKGLRIHQARCVCQQSWKLEQRSDVTSGETEEESSQETNHSTRNLYTSTSSISGTQNLTDQEQVFSDDDPLLELLKTQEDPIFKNPSQTNPTSVGGNPSPPTSDRKPRILWPTAYWNLRCKARLTGSSKPSQHSSIVLGRKYLD